jgi:phosphoenolpyruvate carboxykinase (ATP)
MQIVGMPGNNDLEHHGLHHLKTAYWNLLPAALIEQIIFRQEAVISQSGAVVVNTGIHTGRSPNDKYIVDYGTSLNDEIYWGKVNHPLSRKYFSQIHQKMCAYLQGRDVFVQDLQIGSHPDYCLPVRIITEKAWAALFAYNLLIRTPVMRGFDQSIRMTVLHCPDFYVDPMQDGTNSSTVICLDFKKNLVLIAGTGYAGEIKKALFTAMNYFLPRKGLLPMHCSANMDKNGAVALFFGLSGTGKTTLSSDLDRSLIGDDEHAWCDDGVFNIEGGCYAKTIHLRSELEPIIWNAAHHFGTVLENITIDPYTRILDFEDDHHTENTRGAYPLEFVPNSTSSGCGGHPNHIFFLTADAFGVLPPIARLTPEQAIYYFLSGYTSKLAGTETGLGPEPQATFSTCFGAPFLPLDPMVYANLLIKKIEQYHCGVWLINTGWTGGPYGVGQRMRLPYTRAMIKAVLSGKLDTITFQVCQPFGLAIPTTCPDVPSECLNPVGTWSDPAAFENQARQLVASFINNFEQFKSGISDEITCAGPQSLKPSHP